MDSKDECLMNQWHPQKNWDEKSETEKSWEVNYREKPTLDLKCAVIVLHIQHSLH